MTQYKRTIPYTIFEENNPLEGDVSESNYYNFFIKKAFEFINRSCDINTINSVEDVTQFWKHYYDTRTPTHSQRENSSTLKTSEPNNLFVWGAFINRNGVWYETTPTDDWIYRHLYYEKIERLKRTMERPASSTSQEYIDLTMYVDMLSKIKSIQYVKDSEIEALNAMELELSRKFIGSNLKQWREYKFAVVDIAVKERKFHFHGFFSKEDAMSYSHKLQIDKYNSNENPYYIGHVFPQEDKKLDEVNEANEVNELKFTIKAYCNNTYPVIL